MSRSPETTHKIMSSIKSKNTRPELTLRKELWRRGLRYRVNVSNLPGKPDIVFTRVRLAVFCDGDFWHGHNWAIRGYGSLEEELRRYSSSWGEKILRNIERDQQTTEKLTAEGWLVIRLWESDIKANLKKCADQVEYHYWDSIRSARKEIENHSEYV